MNNSTNVYGNKSLVHNYGHSKGALGYRLILLSSAYCTLMITGLIMNLLVIYAIAKRRLLRRSINYFIFNMAVADILLCCSQVPSRFTLVVSRGSWALVGVPGVISCKIVNFFSTLAPIVSILSLVFMTVDRFIAITYPTQANLRTHKVRRTLIVISWVIPVLYSSKNFYSFVIAGNSLRTMCGEFWGKNHVTIMTILVNLYTVAFILVPLVLLALMYGAIAITLQKGQAFSQNAITSDQQRIRQRQRKRINILAFSIVLAFAICHIPFYVYVYIMNAFVSKWVINQTKTFQDMVKISYVLAFSNATINPVICIVFNREIKKSVKDLMPFFFRRPFGGGSFDFGRHATCSSSGMRSLEFDNRTMVMTNSISRINETENI